MKTSTDAGEILVAYKQCLVYKFRECEKEAKEIKKNLKDSLQKEFLVRYSNEIPDGKSDTTRDQLVYDFCGYIIHTHNEVCGTCKDCIMLCGIALDCHVCRLRMKSSFFKVVFRCWFL